MVHGVWAHNTLMRLAILGVCQGQNVVGVHHMEATGTQEGVFTDDESRRSWADGIAADWNTNCKSAWLGAHTSDYTLLSLQSQVLERPTLYEHKLTPTDRTPSSPVVGTIGAPADDMTTSVVIKWRSTLAGKSHRGRSYIGPLSDTQSDQGRLVTAQTTLYTAYLNVMISRYTGASPLFVGANLTIYSRPYDTGDYQYVRRGPSGLEIVTPPDYAGNSTFVTNGALDSILRTQRRRQIGVGA